jgi:hypothetical protein
MRHTRIVALLGACCIATFARAAHAQERKLLYSALHDFQPTPVRAMDEEIVRREALPVARRLWGRREGCGEEFQIVDAAYGAFTQAGMSQHALLYRFCETGHDFARGGIAITQAGHVVAHVIIENAEPDGIRRLPDIDRNGVAELLLVDNALFQGERSTVVSIVQLVPRGVRPMGVFAVYHDDSGTLRRDSRQEASLLYAIPGPRPRFELETYEHPEGSRARWIGSERLHPITPLPDRTSYRRVK